MCVTPRGEPETKFLFVLGDRGLPGPIGYPGEVGEAALKGDKGEPALEALMGPPGIPGPDGPKGEPGLSIQAMKGEKASKPKNNCFPKRISTVWFDKQVAVDPN